MQIATEACETSRHFKVLRHQAAAGFGDEFPAMWRNLTNHLSETQLLHACIIGLAQMKEAHKGISVPIGRDPVA